MVRTGLIEDPLFKSGTIFDQLKNADGSATDVTFVFPKSWVFSRGPNLDVRDVQTSDSAFLLVAKGKNVDTLKKKFFTDVLFDPAGKYGAYGTVDDFSVTKSEMLTRKAPSGKEQAYRRLSIKFAALTYNQNTLERRAEMMATEVGGSIYMLCAGCQARNYKVERRTSTRLSIPSARCRARGAAAAEAKAKDEDDEFKTAEEYAANKESGCWQSEHARIGMKYYVTILTAAGRRTSPPRPKAHARGTVRSSRRSRRGSTSDLDHGQHLVRHDGGVEHDERPPRGATSTGGCCGWPRRLSDHTLQKSSRSASGSSSTGGGPRSSSPVTPPVGEHLARAVASRSRGGPRAPPPLRPTRRGRRPPTRAALEPAHLQVAVVRARTGRWRRRAGTRAHRAAAAVVVAEVQQPRQAAPRRIGVEIGVLELAQVLAKRLVALVDASRAAGPGRDAVLGHRPDAADGQPAVEHAVELDAQLLELLANLGARASARPLRSQPNSPG